MDCEFCNLIETVEEDFSGSKTKVKFRAALVVKLVRKKYFNRIVDLGLSGKGFKLNYCPECGRSYKDGQMRIEDIWSDILQS